MGKPIYATKQSPCPICGRQDWCCYLPSNSSQEEGGLYICRQCQTRGNVMSPINGKQYQYLKETMNGDAIFVIAKEVRQQVPISKPILVLKKNQEEETPALPNEKLDRIYRSFLSLLTLNEEHKNLLKEEGWGKELIEQSQFCSMPSIRNKKYIAKELVMEFGSLIGVPGFYPSNGGWSFSGAAGILMPLLDSKGQIFRLRIRQDNPERDDKGKEKNKYKNFASWGKDGCQAGMQIGIVQNPADEKKRFYITEGEKKAYVGHYYLKSRIVNLTGVNCFHFLTQPNGTEEPILSYIKKTGGEIPIIAFDADATTNPKVMQAQTLLVKLLKNQFDQVAIATWNSGFGKGLDDILLAGIVPNIIYV